MYIVITSFVEYDIGWRDINHITTPQQTSNFLWAICDLTSGHTKYHKVLDESSEQDLSTDVL